MSEEHDRDKARRKVVALRYNAEKDAAPKVIAKGSGFLADSILEIAREHGIHIQQDPELLAVLTKLNVNDDIPENLYRAVAEILAFVYRLNNRMKR